MLTTLRFLGPSLRLHCPLPVKTHIIFRHPPTRPGADLTLGEAPKNIEQAIKFEGIVWRPEIEQTAFPSPSTNADRNVSR